MIKVNITRNGTNRHDVSHDTEKKQYHFCGIPAKNTLPEWEPAEKLRHTQTEEHFTK